MLRDEDLLDPKREPDDLSWAQALIGQPVSEAAPVQEGPTVDERLAAALAARPAVDPEAGRYEREFAEQNQQQPGWQRTLARVAAGIAESTGTKGAIENLRSQENAYQQRYGQGLTDARQRDQRHAFADPALVRLLSEAGLSPEEAAQTRGDSEALRYLPALGSLDLRRRGQELSAQQKEAALAAQDERQLRQIEAADTRQDRSIEAAATRQDKALAAKKKGGGGKGAALTPEQKAAEDSSVAGYLAQSANVPLETAKAFVSGQRDGVEPGALERLEVFAAQFSRLPEKDKAKVISASLGREARRPDAINDQVEGKKRDPNKLVEYRREISNSGAAIQAASQAWQEMTPAGKQAMAQLSGESWASGTLRDIQMSPEDQARAARIQALANQIIKATSGAAVSDSEWTRIAREMGLAGRNFDALKSPDAIGAWINNARAGWVRNKKAIESEFKLKPGGGQ